MLSSEKNASDSLSFVNMLVHDMKTPVNAQLRVLELLASGAFGNFSDEVSFLIKNMIISNKHLKNLIENLLCDYRLKNGKYEIKKARHNFDDTLNFILNQLNILSELKNQKIAVIKKTKEIVFEYDETEIIRVFINLFSNAFDYAKPDIEIKFYIDFSDNRFKAKIESVTNCKKTPFNQDIILGNGLGLGLVICKTIIEAHGGASNSYTTNDNRFIFEFNLPAF